MQNHKKYKIAFILVVIIIILLSFTLFLYIKAPIFFKPKHKVIQYQEEVKLSNGEMIWVDIKRHYRLTGGAPGDGAMLTGNYLPSIVEISWDTGFEGVGRRSVFYDSHLSLIDKINDEWYVVGYRYPYEGSREGIDAVNCRDVGFVLEKSYDCLVIVNKQGNYINKSSTEIKQLESFHYNLLFSIGDVDFEDNIQPYMKDNRLSWQAKTQLQNRQSVTKPYIFSQE